MAKKIKRYNCPYCSFRSDRETLVNHIVDKHEEMIPEGYTARRVVFNLVNKKTSGRCVICGKETKWIEEAGHYDRYCDDPKTKCRDKAREQYLKNVVAVRGTNNLMADPEFQKKLLDGRRISGKYTFQDGGVRSYTGSYEKNLLEMADKMLNIESKHIMTPGPTLEYSYNGEKHHWIIDQYWIPWNLLIEVKDGGTNPNTRSMPEYRTKQICKEVMITDRGDYNYLRLTNNQFPQLLEILMEIKKENMNGNSDQAIIKIYEDALLTESADQIKKKGIESDPSTIDGVYWSSGNITYSSGVDDADEIAIHKRGPVDPRAIHGVLFVAYSFVSDIDDEDIEGFALQPELISKSILTIENGKICTKPTSFLNNRNITIFEYTGDKTIHDILTKDTVGYDYFYEALTGKKMFIKEQAVMDIDNFRIIDPARQKYLQESYEATMYNDLRAVTESNSYFPMMSAENIYTAGILESEYPDITVLEDIDGYFIYNKILDQRSKSYSSITDIPEIVAEQINSLYVRESVYHDSTEFLRFND